MDDARLRVCLERVVELEGARLRLRDWPGRKGPLIHVPDPVSPTDDAVLAVASTLAPSYRVLSLSPRGDQPYQVDAADLLATLAQFGFLEPIVIGERLGCVAALLVAAWHPDRIGRLVLLDPVAKAPPGATQRIAARALHDCPPGWLALRGHVNCPVLELQWSPAALKSLQDFLS